MQVRPIKNFYFDNEGLPDRAIMHRALVVLGLTRGLSRIKNPLISPEIKELIDALLAIGVDISINEKMREVFVGDVASFKDAEFRFSISKTSVRLLLGALSGKFCNYIFKTGGGLRDEVFNRTISPLNIMGASISSSEGKMPLIITPSTLKGIRYDMITHDPDVKGAMLLAGLSASSPVVINELSDNKNHLEVMLKYLGATISIDAKRLSILGAEKLQAKDIYVPGDLTYASYIIGLGMLCGKKGIRVKNVGVNPTRNAILEVFKAFGIKMKLDNILMKNGEPIADITVAPSYLNGVTIKREMIPFLVDELPLIMAMACFADGETVIEGITPSLYKENPAFAEMQENLTKMGADITVSQDTITILGKEEIAGGVTLESLRDYRVAMGLAVCGARSKDGCYINDFDCVRNVYPEFRELLF